MPGPRIRWDYDQLTQIARVFAAESEKTRSTLNALRQQTDVLRGGDWIGEGAQAFYAEMDSQVLPGFNHLVSALDEAEKTTQKIGTLAQDTEDAAARLLGRLIAMSALLGMLSPAAGAALTAAIAAVAAAQRAQALSNPATAFSMMGDASLAEAEAPASIKIPSQLSNGMKDAWKDSFPGGVSHEEGGILVKKADGTIEWRRGASSGGTSGTFDFNYGDLKPGETLVATAHTHPYDASEGSHTDVPFSGQDMARLVYVKDPISLVQSGNGQFALARTKEFDDSISKLSAADKTTMFNNMKSDWDSTFASAKGTLEQRSDAAVKAVASKYHLVYYKGSGDTLTK
jgi:WXG100 family type VII secretion target